MTADAMKGSGIVTHKGLSFSTLVIAVFGLMLCRYFLMRSVSNSAIQAMMDSIYLLVMDLLIASILAMSLNMSRTPI